MSDNNVKLETKTKNINNQKLFKEIDDFMIEVFTAIGIDWKNKHHREQLVMMLEQWLDEFADQTGKIIQYDVICDKRNNPRLRNSGKIRLTLKYRQKNCYNTTEIDYIFTIAP